MKVRNQRDAEKPGLVMTPMIDIVFQLLIFFIMTFKIVVQEGDFNIKMPAAAMSEGLPDDTLPPLRLRMTADQAGNLTGMRLNDKNLGNSENRFHKLHNEILNIVGDERGPGSVAEEAEIELHCDYDLNYSYVIQAITAVSGYISEDDRVIKLIEKIKFKPSRERG